MIKQIAITSTAAVALLLSGCSTFQTGLNKFAPKTRTPDIAGQASAQNAPSSWVFGTSLDGPIVESWQNIVSDPALLALIDEALASNRSLSASTLNITRAQYILEDARQGHDWAFSYNVSPSLSTNVEKIDLQDRYSAGLNASWEPDLWGRIDADIAGAEYDLAGTKMVYESARQSLIGQVTRSYISAIEARLQRDLTAATLAAQEETLRIANARYEFGEASRRELVLSQSDVASARDSLIVADANLRGTIRALELLLGRYPSGALEIPGAFPPISASVTAGQPADLLRRRPDVLIAEYDVLSAFSGEYVARARNWPSLSLSTGLGSGGGNLLDLLDPGEMALDLGLRLADEIFDLGADDPLILASETVSDQALRNYGATVLDAFADVENALDDIALADERYGLIEQAAEAARETLRLAGIQYKAGDLDLLDVLTFRQRSFQADRALISIQRQSLDARIALYLALGGGSR